MISENIYSNENIQKAKSKVYFENIKSDFILKKIFNIMKKNKFLDIIKYNKKLQKRFNLSINDYKDYFQLYSPIEIELEIFRYNHGNFINISNDEKEYYHIYFDDSKEEIKRNYFNKDDYVKNIKIIIDYQVKSFNELFAFCKCINSISFKKFHRTNITDTVKMFDTCLLLKEIDFSNFNTDNVTEMSYMFSGCSLLKELVLSNFNTNNVTDMRCMFYGCSGLKKINLSNFNTSKVIYMNGMFHGCKSLRELNVSNFNTNNVVYMTNMFFDCSSLEKLDLSNFNTNKVIDMKRMFFGCSSLKVLNLTILKIKNEDNLDDIFTGYSDDFKKKIKILDKGFNNSDDKSNKKNCIIN